MKRNFSEILERICSNLELDLAKELEYSARYWAPETVWERLSRFVNQNVKIKSTCETSVTIYSILCDLTKEEMKKKMRNDGF